MDDQERPCQLCADLNAKSDEDLADFLSKNDGRERAAAKTRAIYS